MIWVGDIHGYFSDMISKIERTGICNEIFVQVGDFNIGYNTFLTEYYILNNFNNKLKEKNNKLYVIRGNHDCRAYFTKDSNALYEFFSFRQDYHNGFFKSRELEEVGLDIKMYAEFITKLSNIIFVEDYTILNIENKNIFCVGGAISIDRKKLKENITYWSDEKFILNTEILEKIRDIDCVVTHSCPNFCFPQQAINDFVREYTDKDKELKKDILKERRDLKQMWDILIQNNNITHYFYGHFHKSNKEVIENTEFILLDIDEFYMV